MLVVSALHQFKKVIRIHEKIQRKAKHSILNESLIDRQFSSFDNNVLLAPPLSSW